MYDTSILKYAQLKKGWTNLELAARAKIPESTVRGMFQRGSAHPRTIKKVARVLRVKIEDLITAS